MARGALTAPGRARLNAMALGAEPTVGADGGRRHRCQRSCASQAFLTTTWLASSAREPDS